MGWWCLVVDVSGVLMSVVCILTTAATSPEGNQIVVFSWTCSSNCLIFFVDGCFAIHSAPIRHLCTSKVKNLVAHCKGVCFLGMFSMQLIARSIQRGRMCRIMWSVACTITTQPLLFTTLGTTAAHTNRARIKMKADV